MSKTELQQFEFNFDAPEIDLSVPADKVKARKMARQQAKAPTRAKKEFVFHFMDLLTAPIIVFNTSWPLPPKLKSNITMARMIQSTTDGERASIPEVAAYMMSRTFESPMPWDWTNIYCYCCTQYLEQFEHRHVPEDMRIDTLSHHETSMLNNLRYWIVKKRQQYVRSTIKEADQ